LTRKLIVSINDELDNEMSKYPDVDWPDAVRKSLRELLQRKEIADMYTGPIERTLKQGK
jgi:hypothetical protein